MGSKPRDSDGGVLQRVWRLANCEIHCRIRPPDSRRRIGVVAGLADRLTSGRLLWVTAAAPGVALVVVLFGFADRSPMSQASLATDDKRRSLYAVKQMKFKPPPTATRLREPRIKRLPIPDPMAGDPEPSRDSIADAPEHPALDDAVIMDLPIPPPPPVSRRETVLYTVGGSMTEPRPLSTPPPDYPEPARSVRIQGQVILECVVDTEGRVRSVDVVRGLPLGLTESAVAAVQRWRFQPATVNGRPVEGRYVATLDFQLEPGNSGASSTAARRAVSAPEAFSAARRFLAERETVDGVVFQEPRGYWANTYVPGDPEIRLLESRLLGRERPYLGLTDATSWRLHDAARQPAHPFDPSDTAALALFVHGDRRGVVGPGRALVQVGLRGTPRYGRRRPAMSVALVLDLHAGSGQETASIMRRLVMAFDRARDVGDRFALVAAGSPDRVVVPPERFRRGTLELALRGLAAKPPAVDDGLAQAVRDAVEVVSHGVAPDAPLGSNVVVVVTDGRLGGRVAALVREAHEAAVTGVILSAVGVGEGVDAAELDRLVLAGHGNRRLMRTAAEAGQVVDRELAAAGRVVARAIRLRIRLAPGVRLVEVVGSQRLGKDDAQKVREAEQSVDLCIARTVGIAADRGEDEEGIQIVIPAFFAGDAHSVLLDVVVPGPGPVVDVTVRYKDLVRLRNGVSRANLTLGRNVAPPGPLELAVLKNLLAVRLARGMREAADLVAGDRRDEAVRALRETRDLLTGIATEVPGLNQDRDLADDLALLEHYVAVAEAGGGTEGQRYLVDSLRYAGWRKLMPTRGSDEEV